MGAELNRFNSFKLLAHVDKLRAIANGENPFPLDWHIYPSNICPHSCSWCMFRQNGEQFNFRVQLPRELLLRAVRDAARTGAILIHFSGGGEPLVNKHTLEAIALTKELGLETALSTNGRLLTPEVAQFVDNIRISLNAGTPEQHHRTNHAGNPDDKGDWFIILENIAKCLPFARRDFGLGFVVDHENWRDIYPFCETAARLFASPGTGDRFVHIRPGFYYEKDKDAAVRAAMPDALKMCDDARRDFGDVVDIHAITEKFDNTWKPRRFSRCRAIHTGTCLRATGDFAVCQDRTDLSFGKEPSYKAGAAFEDVWFSEERAQLTATIHDGIGGVLPDCPRCVWGFRNELIDAVENDELRLSLI